MTKWWRAAVLVLLVVAVMGVFSQRSPAHHRFVTDKGVIRCESFRCVSRMLTKARGVVRELVNLANNCYTPRYVTLEGERVFIVEYTC